MGGGEQMKTRHNPMNLTRVEFLAAPKTRWGSGRRKGLMPLLFSLLCIVSYLGAPAMAQEIDIELCASRRSVDACSRLISKSESDGNNPAHFYAIRGTIWDAQGKAQRANEDYRRAIALTSEERIVKQGDRIACSSPRYLRLLENQPAANRRQLEREAIDNGECIFLRKGQRVISGPNLFDVPFRFPGKQKIWWVYDKVFRSTLEELDTLARLEALQKEFDAGQKHRAKPQLELKSNSPLPAWRPLQSKRPLQTKKFITSPQLVFAISQEVVWGVIGQNKQGQPTVQGSAVAVAQRHLLTNCHVAAEAAQILLVRKGIRIKAELTAADPKTDRCILKVDSPLQMFVGGIREFASMAVGERVYTIGSPRGLEHTLGEGLISGLRVAKGRRLVQTSAPISPGSSGGGLFDGDGNLVGITTFMLKDSQALNFAIPAEDFWDR